MKRRSFSNSLTVAEWRYIQSIHETGELQNPDTFGGHFLSVLARWRCAWLGKEKLATLRANPLYYYLVARTKYYDGIFLKAISDNVRYIVNVGCGSDTRSHRFEPMLKQHGVQVLECDQPEAISDKQHIAKRWGASEHVSYMPIDINDESWPNFEQWLTRHNTARILVMIEGVSPYINVEAFNRFLSLFSRELAVGSRVAYDFKFAGVADSFGIGGRTQEPFRLPTITEEVVRYHEKLGYRVTGVERSSELTARLLTSLTKAGGPFFTDDGLIQLEVV